MNKNNENKLVPRLRFPEFWNDREWSGKSFSQLFEFGNGKDYKHLLSGDIPVYGTGGKMLLVNDYLYDGESVCIGRKGTIDKPLYLTGKFWTVDTLFYTHSFVNCIPKFIHYVFQNINWYDYNEAGGVPSLSKTTIRKIRVLIPPSIKEQQKIAACLSSLDEVITAENQKLTVLKEHKKGLLQNLFPQEGETLPKFRFKEFEDSGEWVEKSFEEICDVNPSSNQLPFEFVYIDLESVDNGILKKVNKITLEGAPSRAQRLLKKNDVIYQMVRPYQMNNYFFQAESEIKYVASTGYAQLRAFESSEFLFQLIHTQYFVDKVLTRCTGSNYPAINSSDLKLIELQIPKNPKEQQKIAETLSSVDDLINAQNQKIEALQLHKKGLLQGLFPTINNEA
ncbi:MAG: restriction endonuclease subunit S [Cytophagales bacterium]|nr:MAG: restriction endonuclease subunit S [Runella sp.]TAG80210.1 MAG: restriction endonuclease subunit S [Cytophagales bacterium]